MKNYEGYIFPVRIQILSSQTSVGVISSSSLMSIDDIVFVGRRGVQYSRLESSELMVAQHFNVIRNKFATQHSSIVTWWQGTSDIIYLM